MGVGVIDGGNRVGVVKRWDGESLKYEGDNSLKSMLRDPGIEP